MKVFKNAITLTIALIFICGLVFPLAVTAIGQLAFNNKANGSIIEVNGKKVGSELMGQNFTDERFFHGRPSAVSYNTYTTNDIKPDKDGKVSYSGVASGSTNLAPSNPALKERVEKDINEFLKSHKGVKKEDIPADLMTMSGSGLDPDISIKAAQIQIPLISEKTGISEEQLQKVVKDNTKEKSLGVFGQERVNVLKANLAIEKMLK